jgi:hypothetical protein
LQGFACKSLQRNRNRRALTAVSELFQALIDVERRKAILNIFSALSLLIACFDLSFTQARLPCLSKKKQPAIKLPLKEFNTIWKKSP